MALFIARHGQTDWNRQGRFQSTTDVPLNDTGREQAQLLGEQLRQRAIQFSRVWSSPRVRALETAEIIVSVAADNLTPADIQHDAALVELSLGHFEGRYADDLKLEYGDEFTEWQTSGFIDAAPGGESMQEAVSRVTPSVSRLRSLALQENVLLVAHQGANMAIKSALEGVLNVERLNHHRQANDEIDIWDEALGKIVERLTLSLG